MKRRTRDVSVDDFINGADSKPETKKSPTKPIKKFKVSTFSLDETTIDSIDDLSRQSRNITVSKSDVVKAAVRLLLKQDLETFESLIKEIK